MVSVDYRPSCLFCKVNDIVIYWGFRHLGQVTLRVMETLFLCLRELVKEQGRGYDFKSGLETEVQM
jgi:hypothetical protein